ncbi:MAG: hypothetical protein AAFU67_10140 [Bacteroidota bacterium]
MNLIKQLTLSLCLLLLANYNFAQTHEVHELSTEQHGNNEGYFEVIASIINVISLEGDEGNIGNEFHLTYWFNHQLGSGVSITTKLEEDDGLLYDTALIGSWSPLKWMTANLGLNFSWANEHREFAISAYAEIEINFFVIDQIHIGPIIGTLIGSESELTHGFHLGFEF